MTTNPQTSTVFDKLVTQRRPVAMALAGLGVALMALAVWWCVWGWPTRATSDADNPSALGKTKGEVPKLNDEKDTKSATRQHSEDYLPAGVWAGLLAVACMGSAAWLITQPLPTDSISSVVRAEVLTFGSIVGVLTALLGAAFGVSWYNSLFIWVNEDNAQEARWVLIAVAVFVSGLVIIFLSVQVARTEERANAILRRVAYGFNAVFMGLLLLLVLAALNVVSFMKLPGMLVTNDAAFTSLAEPSKKFLRSLNRPVRAYLVMPEKLEIADRGLAYKNLYTDCRALLTQCEEESPNFKTTFLSPALDPLAVNKLWDQMKVADKANFAWGIVLALGDNEDDFVHIPYDKLLSQEANGAAFQGEQRLLTELIAKSSSLTDKTIYFTQNHGELSIDPARGGEPRSAYQMLDVLRERKVKIAPLQLDEAHPTIPKDAAMVVVAGPQQTIDRESITYKALQNYLRPTDPSQTPGKLLAFLPAVRGPNNTVIATGLEPLLAEYGVVLAPTARVAMVSTRIGSLTVRGDRLALAMPAKGLDGSLARAFQSPFPFLDPRGLQAAPGNPAYAVRPLLTTTPGFGAWRESNFIVADYTQLQRELGAGNNELRQQKEYTTTGVSLAVTVSEQAAPTNPNEKPREAKAKMIVFASESLIQDQLPFPWVPDDAERRQAVSDCVDWLTEREANMGIQARQQNVYMLKKEPTLGSLLMLLAMLASCVMALGIGVWLSRRK